MVDRSKPDAELLRRMMMGEFSSPAKDNKAVKSEKKSIDIVDLHFDKLYPSKGHLPVADKFLLQLNAAEEFILQAAKAGKKSLTIIVGKGEGKLKTAIIKLAKDKNCRDVSPLYDPPYFGNALKLKI